MVRETRHLWVGNLPDNVREERIREHFQRYLSTCSHFPCFNHILHVCRSTILVISEKVISVICKNWCKNGGGVAASEEEEAESCFFPFPFSLFLLVAFSVLSSDILGPSPSIRCGAAKPRAFNRTWRHQLIVAPCAALRCVLCCAAAALFCGQATRR